ncbi:MAG: FadR family transcriptional regulator [Caldilineaceae bacterium]|nr:FadR family transcriptional regulator [Caldilineaceae bacterium]
MAHARIDSDFLQHLLTNGYQPGDRLPPLNQLSVEIGVSVGKLREQLEVARALGLIEASPRRGITRLEYEFRPAVSLSLLIALVLDPAYFDSFGNLRQHLEYAYWDEAVARLTEEDKHELNELVESAQAMLRRPRIQIPFREHRAFHMAIFRRLDNPFVMGLLEAYWDGYEAVELNTYADYPYLQEVWDYHARIAAAIDDGNVELSKRLLGEHMQLLNQRGASQQDSIPTT